MADERRGIEVFDGDGPDGDKFVEATVDLLIRTFPELRDCERAWIEKQIDSTSAFILEAHRRGASETIKKPFQSGSPNPKGSPCPTCYGTAEKLDADGNRMVNAIPCEDCLGSGREMEQCPNCFGAGGSHGGHGSKCDQCNGTGKRIKLKVGAHGSSSPGMPLSPKPTQLWQCQDCGGTGKEPASNCDQCGTCLGTGKRDPNSPMSRMKKLANVNPEE